MNHKTLPNKIGFLALSVALVLLLLFAVMQITGGMDWSMMDFIFAGGLLFGAGLAYLFISSGAGSITYKAAAGIVVATALALVWSNAAVGIIGSEDNPANRMVLGVPAVLIVGALLARFQPQGMARAAFATALAQALVTAVALLAVENVEVVEVLLLNAFFIAMWVVSAVLFQRAGQPEHPRLD